MKETLEWTKLIESWIKIVAIFTAGMWTWWLFVRRRQKYPRAITSHAVQIHELDSNTRLVHLELAIENKGEVLVEISEGKAFIQQIVPLAGNVQSLTENGQNELNWPYIDRIIRLSELKRMEIEPSEKRHHPL